ncbi:hypothetical protein L211DRAFT_144716 [Terfezia boudieri ATCC MYA-4762]|uniref:Yeast cell wall synthesis Kre9/Knh1-like N-terminal domain-containing protein n=1 Tax=Terfezia boudieri ATCC MYA-4762 TaxID=1051890 RepID=A0A3N4LT64_9PEZI|nr:hypothetical protein L211DRAFT_871953 [Terfezia boudieri ATCC MYA-4762]RPB24729.1 hypothetical protein L211DRAFT_144716 [Terfezia boudieri ATCC MYA-4762]
MRFSTAALVALSTLAAIVFAAENQITYPGDGDTVQVGQTIVIKWIPDTKYETVKLFFRKVKSDDLDISGPICDNCPNSGSCEWTVPEVLPASNNNYHRRRVVQLDSIEPAHENYTIVLFNYNGMISSSPFEIAALS